MSEIDEAIVDVYEPLSIKSDQVIYINSLKFIRTNEPPLLKGRITCNATMQSISRYRLKGKIFNAIIGIWIKQDINHIKKMNQHNTFSIEFGNISLIAIAKSNIPINYPMLFQPAMFFSKEIRGHLRQAIPGIIGPFHTCTPIKCDWPDQWLYENSVMELAKMYLPDSFLKNKPYIKEIPAGISFYVVLDHFFIDQPGQYMETTQEILSEFMYTSYEIAACYKSLIIPAPVDEKNKIYIAPHSNILELGRGIKATS